jgi:peptide/nickel transport system substrate-binding protein
VGEYVAPSAVRKGITGLVVGPGDFYWNIRKEQ